MTRSGIKSRPYDGSGKTAFMKTWKKDGFKGWIEARTAAIKAGWFKLPAAPSS